MLNRLSRGLRWFCQGKKPYIYPYNVNRQQEKKYLRNVEQEVKRVENAPPQLLPRRKRRIYDKLKFNTDLTNYGAWRTFDDDRFAHLSGNTYPLALKLMLSPKWLVHCFGQGFIPTFDEVESSREYYFEDSNLSHFLVSDYRQTTLYKPNKEGYNYADQSMVEPRKRLVERVDPQVFWTLDKEFEFRVYSTKHAQNQKFKAWLLKMIEQSKTKPSYDQFIDEKFGKAYCFNRQEDTKYYQVLQPLVKYVDKSHFTQAQKVPDAKAKKQQPKKDKKKKKEEAVAQKVETSQQQNKPVQIEQKTPTFVFAKSLPQQLRVEKGGSVFQIFAEQQEKKNQSQQIEKQKGGQPEEPKEKQKKQKQANKAS